MGWFDSDNKGKGQAPQQQPASSAGPAAPPPAPPARPVTTGSTVGGRMKVTGKIVSDEDLEIVGRVEGEIRAREMLSISKDAEVRAVVHGRRIVLEGALHGDIHASELVVLGTSSTMQGDIHTPTLEIREGALFRGAVKMKAAQERDETTAAARSKAAPKPAPGTARADGEQAAAAIKADAANRERESDREGAAEGGGQQELPATSSAG